MILKIIAFIFIVFAESRVILRFREKTITTTELITWSSLWLCVGAIALVPTFSTFIAKTLGVGRGVDALIYISIIVLFYGLFRMYVKLEHIEHEITDIVRKQALQEDKKINENFNRR